MKDETRDEVRKRAEKEATVLTLIEVSQRVNIFMSTYK